MELRTHMENSRSESAEQNISDWPECLYREGDANKRFQMLGAAEREGISPEVTAVIRTILEKRYVPGDIPADNFIKFWLTCTLAGNSIHDGEIPGRDAEEVRHQAEALGFAQVADELEELLYKEFYHTAILYIHLSLKDKHYGSMFYGFGRLSDERLARKICSDVFQVGYIVPEIIRFPRYEVWERALKDACIGYFDEGKEFWDEELTRETPEV